MSNIHNFVNSGLSVNYTLSYTDFIEKKSIQNTNTMETSNIQYNSITLFYKINIKNNGKCSVYLNDIQISIIDTLYELLENKINFSDSDSAFTVEEYFELGLISNKIKNENESKKIDFFNLNKKGISDVNDKCGNILDSETCIKPNESGYINFVLCIIPNSLFIDTTIITDILNWAVSSSLTIKGYVKQCKCKCCPPVDVCINTICFNKPEIIKG